MRQCAGETGRGDGRRILVLIVVVAFENAEILKKPVSAHYGRPDDYHHRGQADGDGKCESVVDIHFRTP